MAKELKIESRGWVMITNDVKIARHAIGPLFPVLEEDTALFEDGGQRPIVVSHLLLEDGQRAHALQTVVDR